MTAYDQPFDWTHCISCGKELGPNNGMQPCLDCWKNEMISTLEALPRRERNHTNPSDKK